MMLTMKLSVYKEEWDKIIDEWGILRDKLKVIAVNLEFECLM